MDNHFAVRNKRVTNQTIKSISNNTLETRWMEHWSLFEKCFLQDVHHNLREISPE